MGKKQNLCWYIVLLLLIGYAAFSFSDFFRQRSVRRPVSPSMESAETPSMPSASDGAGSAAVSPAGPVIVGSPGTWTITFTVGQPGIAVGGGVVLHISPFWGWTPPQTASAEQPGYVSVQCSRDGADLAVSADGRLHYVLARIGGAGLRSGDTITFVYGDTGQGRAPGAAARADRFAERGERFYLKVDGDGDGYFAPISAQPKLDVMPEAPDRLILSAPSLVSPGEQFMVQAAALDARENYVADYHGSPRIRADRAGVSIVRSDNQSLVRYACRADAEGTCVFYAADSAGRLFGRSNPVLCRKSAGQYKLYWADLHGHSQRSDGTGTPDDYFRYARLAAGLDAAALTDHDAWGFDLLDEREDIWQELVAAAQRNNLPGRFITTPAYEWTNWTYGHKHVLFFGSQHPLISSRKEAGDTPEKLWAALRGMRAFTIPHHVGGGPVATDWDHHDAELEPVVEICSVHGSSECAGCEAEIYRPKAGSFVRDALARGYKLGIIGGGDTHNGHPGMGDPSASTGGLTAFWAPELTREALYNALRERRVYGTSGAKIILRFTVNGHVMGRVLPVASNKDRNLFFEAVGSSKIARIEIIKNGAVLESRSPAAVVFSDTITDRDVTPAYYYVRVVQEDGEMAWSSPVWFE